MAWFKRREAPKVKAQGKVSVPSGVWRLCDACGTTALAEEIAIALETCPSCGRHFRMGARARLGRFLDVDSMVEHAGDLAAPDPLGFKDQKKYVDRLKAAEKSAGENEAFILAEGRLHGTPVVAGAFEFKFLGGSMGSVVGEKVTRAFELGSRRASPVILFSASGGARMQEGIVSLMQMAKTSAAIARFREVGRPYVSVLTDPTTGGVAASFALLGDIIIAEPGALVGFAGPRVIEQTIRQKLPEGFQRSEYLLEHGVIDMIVHRRDLRDRVAQIVAMLAPEQSMGLG
ncbi:MAG: acetyl-CoA carboxylase carboxyltransferase subunit beta [Deltaproteobacteria bacterium]|nr:acetyl-CoA carboxylase carboxyltransferase subunit beta [Deltaproteobacteria bacterium]